MAEVKTISALSVLPFRILSFYAEAAQLLNNQMPLPRMAVLHTNYTCNHRCKGCDYRGINNKSNAIMSRAQSMRLVDEIVDMHIPAVEFAGGGEPTLDPNIEYMIDSFSERGVAMGILTNGTMLKDELLKKIIHKFNYIRISFDAGTPETYRRIRGLDDIREFDRVLSNIKQAVGLKSLLNSPININLKFTVGKENVSEMERAVLLAMQLGVDSIQFSLFENVPSKLSDEAAIFANRTLETLKESYKGKIKIVGNLISTTILHQCWLNPIFTVIDAFGDVYACTYYHHRKERHTLGNIFNDSLRSIWFSQKHWEIIKNIRPEECNIYNCRFHHYNSVMTDLLVVRKNELDFI